MLWDNFCYPKTGGGGGGGGGVHFKSKLLEIKKIFFILDFTLFSWL